MKHLIYILFIAVLMISCKKEKSFSPKPVIEFKDFTSYGSDSANIMISFRDGDGDIGIFEDDTTSKDDLSLKYLYKDSTGNFIPYDATFGTPQFDTLFYSYRVPSITPNGQYQALEGDILIKLRAAPLYNPTHSFVKFEITLTDRAGNISNTVSTKEIPVTP